MDCKIIRRKFVRIGSLNLVTGEMKDNTDTGKWITEPCNIPIFTDAARKTGVCTSCAEGWMVPENYPNRHS
jgi:hypothetical protein